MAETLSSCLTTASSLPNASPLRRSRAVISPSFSLFHFSHSSSSSSPSFLRFNSTDPVRLKASNSPSYFGFDDDLYGIYPWESHSSSERDVEIEWVSEDKITLFTSDGLIQIGGSLTPRHITSSEKKHGKSRVSRRYQRFQEKDYMNPNQSLCLGALFDIAATNGLDTGRRMCIVGFCRSIEMLCDAVEDTVLEHGGEVVVAEKASDGGLLEKLKMTVAVPLLWGIPPATETLHLAVRTGGGIVDKVFWRWDFL